MPTSLQQNGDILDTVATGAVTKGWLIKRGSVLGVALNSATGAGAPLRLAIAGVWTVDKIAAASTNTVVGGKVYGRATGAAGRQKALAVATGAVIGTAFEAAVTGATTVKVKLLGFAN